METVNIKELNDRIQQESSFVDMLSLEMGKVIVGQKQLVENLLIGLLANGTFFLKVFRDLPRLLRSARSRRLSMPSSAGYSSPLTFFRPTSSER
jgi:hypothetical protein